MTFFHTFWWLNLIKSLHLLAMSITSDTEAANVDILDTSEIDASPKASSPWSWLARAIVGLIGVGAGLTVGEVAAAASTRIPSLVIAIGDTIIDSTWVPFWLRRWSIDQLGSAQKPALVAGVVITSLIVGAICGVLARRWSWLPGAVLVVFGVVAGLSAADNPMSSAAWSGFTAGLATAIAIAMFYYLLSVIPDPARLANQPVVHQQRLMREERRRFLVITGAVSVAFLFANILSRALARQVDVEASRAVAVDSISQALASQSNPSTSVPTSTTAANSQTPTSATDAPTTTTTVPEAVELPANLDDIQGISPLITPNNNFYRIDTALVVPRLTAEAWKLSVTGMVDNPLELDFNQLLTYPLVTEPVTLSCVSNPVGGSLVGNAVWTGVRLADVLEDAGVQPGATQISGRSVDNWASGFPTELAFDGRVAMIAVAMNGEALPARHGFPARLVIAGLYGYVSATKWLSEIHLTTWEGFDSYWVPRGWAKEGPIKTQSRIDVPRGDNALLPVGEVAIAGVAWAPHRSISRVEVRIDGGDWADAELSQELSTSSWRQWVHYWQSTPGRHSVAVRATDGNGETQTQQRSRPAPSGATGWHTKVFRVA